MFGVAASGKSVGGGVINDVNLGHGEAGGDSEILYGIIKTGVVLFVDFLGAGHGDGERSGEEILNHGVDDGDDQHPGTNPPVIKKISKQRAKCCNHHHEASHDENGVAFVGGYLLIHRANRPVIYQT